MKMISPLTVTDGTLTSHAVAENDWPAWSSGSTYALADKVIYQHRIYQSLQASNTNHTPSDAASTWWSDIGPTNRWAMFDGKVNTQTTATDSMTVALSMGEPVTGLALLNLSAVSEVQVTVEAGAATVYDQTRTLEGPVSGWEAYFFDPIEFQTDVVFDDLPLYHDATITVAITGTGAIACGVLALGRVYDLGNTLRGVKAGITDYSKKDQDAVGEPIGVIQRGFAKRYSGQLIVERARVDALIRLLAKHRATACVYAGDDTGYYSALIAYGFYKDFSVGIEYPTHSLCNLEIEGLT